MLEKILFKYINNKNKSIIFFVVFTSLFRKIKSILFKKTIFYVRKNNKKYKIKCENL